MGRRNVQEPIFLDLSAKPNSVNAVVTASELATSNSKMLAAFAKVKEIADEMHRFGRRHWMHYEGQTTRDFANRLDAAIKEFVKGEAE